MSHESEFFFAVGEGDLETVKSLLDEEPRLALARDKGGATALHHAAFLGNQAIGDLLLEAGAEINSLDSTHGATPTGWATEHWREHGGLLAIEIEDTLFAIRRGEADWVARFVTRHPALRSAVDGDGVALARHAATSDHPRIRQCFGDASSGSA